MHLPPNSSHNHGEPPLPSPPASPPLQSSHCLCHCPSSRTFPKPSQKHLNIKTSHPISFLPNLLLLGSPHLGKGQPRVCQVHTPSHSVHLPPSALIPAPTKSPWGFFLIFPGIHHSAMMCQAPTLQGFGTLFIQELFNMHFLETHPVQY